MEQRLQAGGDIGLQGGDPLHDVLHRLRGLVLVEIPGHGDLIPHLGLLIVDPGVGGVGQHLPPEIVVDVLHQRHILRVPQGGVCHGLALFQHNFPLLVPQGPLHHDFVVAELLRAEHLALAVHAALFAVHSAVPILTVGSHNQPPAQVGDVVALGADILPTGLIAVGGVDQLHLPGPVVRLVLGQHPDIGADACVHELVGGELDDGVQPVVFQEVLPDAGGAAASVPGEQRGAVLDDGHFAVGVQLGQAVQQEELLPVADLGQSGGKAAQFTQRRLRLHRLLFPLPIDAEGRVGDAVLEGKPLELVVGEGVAKPHIVGVAAPDHHVGLGDGVGGGVQLLPKAGHLNLRIEIVDAFLHAGEHLGGAHGHVVDGDVPGPVQIGVGQENVGHQVDDIPTGEMGPGLLVIGLGEALHQIFENVAAVHGADLVRAEVALGGCKLFDDQIEGIAVHHPLDDVVEVELGKHILNVGGEPGEVVPEVGLDIVRVGQQQVKGELAGVVELVAGRTGEKAVDDRQLFHLRILLLHGGVGRQQAVVEPLHHCHGENHKAILVGLEIAKESVGDVPDHGGLLLDVDSHF